MDVDPYKLFGLTKDSSFTIDELKAKFKQLAMVSHPDRGGSEELFLLVAKCFKTLMKEYNRRVSDSQHHELKKAFDVHASKHRNIETKSDGFDVDRFNSVFEQHRMGSALDTGYQGWMKESSLPDFDETPKKPMAKDKFNVDKFNAQFNKRTVDNNNKFIQKYVEPEPLVMAKRIQFTELGVDNIDDFSGDNTTNRQLNYMDYKVAHTTSRIVDPRLVNRKEYKNVGEVEHERDSLSYIPTSEDVEYWEQKKKRAQQAELKRQLAQQQQDNMAFSQYDKLKQLMLGR